MTTTTWSQLQDVRCGGQSLKNYGYGLQLVGGFDSSPGKVGKNFAVAYKRGNVYVPKRLDELTRTVSMWVDSRHPDGTFPITYADTIRQRNANVREVLAMFGGDSGLVTITRDILLPAEWGGDQVWTAYAEALNPITPEWADSSDEEAFFTVDLTFHDPLWYGPSSNASVVTGTPLAFNNKGSVAIDEAVIKFVAGGSGWSNPQLNNGTRWVKLGSAIAAGDSVTVDCGKGTVKRTSDGANLMGALTFSGAASFMRFERGSQNLTVTATSGSGTAVLTTRTPFL